MSVFKKSVIAIAVSFASVSAFAADIQEIGGLPTGGAYYGITTEGLEKIEKHARSTATVDQLEALYNYNMKQAYAEADAIKGIRDNHDNLVDELKSANWDSLGVGTETKLQIEANTTMANEALVTAFDANLLADQNDRRLGNLVQNLQDADWSSIAGKGGVSEANVGKGLQAVHQDTIKNLTAMNNSYEAKLAAMEAKLAALEEKLNQPTEPSPAPTAEMQKMHNHYQAQMKAMYEKLTADIDNVKPSEPSVPSTDNGLTNEQIKDLEDYLNANHGNSGDTGGTVDTGRLAGLESQVEGLYQEIDTLNDGVSMAMAMSSMPQSTGTGDTVVGAGIGNYNGSSAVAIGVSHKYENITINFKGSTTSNGSNIGVSAGVGYHF